jgi:hypothetical protein
MKIMTEIETVLQTYRAAEALIARDIETIPYKNRTGFMSQRGDAVQSLPKLRTQYLGLLKKAAFGVAVQGANTEKFVALANQEADVLVVDGSNLYKRVADRVASGMGSRKEFGTSEFSHVMQELMAIGSELGLASFPAPKWTDPVNVNTEAGLLEYIKGLIDSSCGVEFVAMYVQKQMCDAGLSASVVGKVIPVLVTNTGKTVSELMVGIFEENRWMTANASNPTKESVLEVFETVKKKLKAKKA